MDQALGIGVGLAPAFRCCSAVGRFSEFTLAPERGRVPGAPQIYVAAGKADPNAIRSAELGDAAGALNMRKAAQAAP